MTHTRTVRLTIPALGAALLLTFGLAGCTGHGTTAETKPSATSSATATSTPYAAPTAAQVAILPEAKYDAVIGGLIPYYESTIPEVADEAYTISSDAPLYGEDHAQPVARLAAKNFLGQATVVVPVQVSGDWAMVLTPARQALPSATNGAAAAQSAAWIRRDLLHRSRSLPDHVVISVGKQTVSIVDADGTTLHDFPAGVGAGGTPTPTGVIGYIQARYLDPAQDQTVHPIQLTTLHSAAADEPYGGTDGGLIGVHYQPVARGAVSHGCVRLDGDAVDAVDALPLGTVVQIVA
ncbi:MULTISPECIES: L,D-transpeptidase [unclassified Curtobacterium]|jgi:lipoprotein-anchoring transpeptidase ErfK/SrfK|uniref:L,D-transpeptidase n=1 Tax=unclassified Curtobacterium TaxID=257496 RepID=UPI002783ED83|nr:L,D-transpeptidase [Curtobacterium sp. 260]MDP9736961.1 lipoprotein-anchoring transpeptidase ErfK/SrfK [Curtobacterium sp. 260]